MGFAALAELSIAYSFEMKQAQGARVSRSIVMNVREHPAGPAETRPTNKATMDQPQEEFIQPDSSHVERDREHGDEMRPAAHANLWAKRQR